ncbi:MAG TPA: GMC family oxidoreductase [Baekduia sp.]
MPEVFDNVIVGSGFGGAPVALRLAEHERGGSVLLLERGRRYGPGDFARSPAALSQNFWDPEHRLYGMFHPWSFHDISAVTASGLGGGSLIYANVMIRKPAGWFQDHDGRPWPITRAELDPHYDVAEQMLGATPYPFAQAPYANTPKTKALQAASRALVDDGVGGLDWELPNLAVSFTPGGGEPGRPLGAPGDNLHDRQRYTCRLCGECDIGCNFGAKNTLDFNYLSAAERAGATIRCLADVQHIVAEDDGYRVIYDEHHPGAGGPPTRHEVRAGRVVVAAGAIGSTRLLMRARAAGGLRNLSDTALGTRFSGNGDFLAFALNTKGKIDPSHGPVITSTLRVAPADEGGPEGSRGFYIQEAGWPELANWLVQTSPLGGIASRAVHFVWDELRRRLSHDADTDSSQEISRLIGNGRLADTSLGFLAMGRDTPDGRFTLSERGHLDLDWTWETSRDYLDGVEDVLRQLAKKLGAGYTSSPTYRFGHRLITVHSLGGCPMGTSAHDGVVDAYGRAFGHPGLYVCDGAALPGPVGPNPSLTIAAFAERCARQILLDAGADPPGTLP